MSSTRQSVGASREAVLRVRPAVLGLRPGGADGAGQLRLPGGTSAERTRHGPGVSGRPAAGRQGGTEEGLSIGNILLCVCSFFFFYPSHSQINE